MRATLTRGSMTLGEDDGGLPPQSTVQAAEAVLADSERLMHQYHERGDDAVIQIALAPCSPFSVTKEIMAEAQPWRNAWTSGCTPTSRRPSTRRTSAGRCSGCGPWTTWTVGWLTDRTWLGHGIHFSDAEIARLGAAGTAVAHCPTSNMRLASGTARVLELEEREFPWGWEWTARRRTMPPT
jgi:8-oxoguanine deaminase